jgi:hypothetical protein
MFLLLPMAPLGARNPDASDPPQTSGPLVGSPFGCEDDGPPGHNEIKAQACSWSYELIPAELDATHDFSAYWLQMEVDPESGCVKEMFFKVTVPPEMRILSAVPSRSRRIVKSRPMTTQLVVDGDGSAPVPGAVSQDLTSAPGRTFVTSGTRTYSYRWRGNSPHKVVVAIGLQLSHPSLPSDSLFSAWSEGLGFGWGSCRPIIIRG